MDIINVLGAVCSIVGAVITVWHARKVVRIRDEVVADRGRMAILDVLPTVKRAREEARKLCPSVSKNGLRGVDIQTAIDAVRDCIDRLDDQGNRFDATTLPEFLEKARQLLGDYLNEPDESRRFKVGQAILHCMSGMAIALAERADQAL